MVVRIDSRLERIVPKFLEGQRHQILRLKVACQDRDFGTLALIGHKAKGTCGGYGFMLLSEMGAELEKAAHARDDKRITSLISAMEEHLNSVTVQYE